MQTLLEVVLPADGQSNCSLHGSLPQIGMDNMCIELHNICRSGACAALHARICSLAACIQTAGSDGE